MLNRFEDFIINEEYVDFYDKMDRIAIYASDKLFFIDGKGLNRIGKGSEGVAYSTGDGKVIKITKGVEEAGAAERLRGKSTRNLMSYYDVREINYYGDKYWALLMDELKPLNETDIHKKAYITLKTYFGWFDDYINGGSNEDIQRISDLVETRKRGRKRAIKKIVDELLTKPFRIDRVNTYGYDMEEFREVCYSLLYDSINMVIEMKRYHIMSADLHAGNLGLDNNNKLIYFDIGYGEGMMKDVSPSKKTILKDSDLEDLKQKYRENS